MVATRTASYPAQLIRPRGTIMTSSHERSPLLSARREPEHSPVSESSPLLYDSCRPRSSSSRQRDDDDDGSSDKGSHKEGAGPRWPSIIAISGLAVLVVLVMVLGFVAPPAVRFYAERAAVLQPTGLSVEALTQDGVRARIQANFQMDGSRVNDTVAQFLGRMATGVVRKLDTEETTLQLYLPSYDNVLLGTVVVPSLTIALVDGRSTAMDFVTELSVRDSQVLRKIVNDWLDGQVKRLEVTGAMAISIRSGVLPLGTHEVVESMVFEAKDVPTIPDYDIGQIKIRDVPLGGGGGGDGGGDGRMAVGANASLIVYNDYPISLTVPSLGFDILVPNCDPSEAHIKVASATTGAVPVQPHANVTVDAAGLIEDLPEALTRACPESDLSPLDVFMKEYLHGGNARVFVRGTESEDTGLPDWIGSVLSSVAVPIDLPGRSFDNTIRNISVTNIDFKLPSPFADPDTPQGKPRVSGTLLVMAAVPPDMQLNVDVNGLQASSDVFYEGKKFGELNVRSWQKAESERLPASGGDNDDNDDDLLIITSRLSQVPLDITDSDVFSDVVQELLFGDVDLVLDISSLVDARVSTVVGALVIKEIPARGKMPIKHLPGEIFKDADIHVRDVAVVGTTKNSVRMRTAVDLVNPTPYTASLPFMSAHVLSHDGHLIGEISCRDVDLRLGQNKNLVVYATWDPVAMGGEDSRRAARQLVSAYISGENTTLTLRAHRGSFPAVPLLGEALSKFNITLPTPRIQLPPDDTDDDKDPNTRFLRNAIFHVFSSTATFDLASPFRYNTIHIERINATAFYDHTEPVGDILYDEPFDVPPGVSPTPRLPVAWSLDSVGWDKLRDALGGSLRLDARAEVSLRIGRWRETVTYAGRGIGAHIRF